MPLYAERATGDLLTGQEIVEQLGAWLAGQYQTLEAHLLGEVARLAARDMNTTDVARRLDAIQRLRKAAADAVAAINTEAAARALVDTAMREGTAAAVEQLGFARAAAGGVGPVAYGAGNVLPFATGLTPGAALAAAQIGLELTNNLTDLNARILRAVPDAYQQTIARFANERALGVSTRRQTHTRAVADFLGQGLTGFRDRAGRPWTIGSYAEMAARTATNRAWIDAHVHTFAGGERNLVSPVRGSDSCTRCAAWAGKILAADGGPTGDVQLQHAITGELVTITIAGSVAEARAGGWNHPNCRCTLAKVFPGLSLPASDTTYDPAAEKARDRLRYLERRVRGFKRKETIAAAMGDDVGAAFFRRKVRAEQARIRSHVSATGQIRKPYREQLAYADGRPGAPAAATPPPIPKPPTAPQPKLERGMPPTVIAENLAARQGIAVEGFAALDADTAFEVAAELDALLTAHPYARLAGVAVRPQKSFGSGGQTSIAQARTSYERSPEGGPVMINGRRATTPAWIELNRRFALNRPMMTEATVQSRAAGWTYQDDGDVSGWSTTIRHEFGHVIDFAGNMTVRDDHAGYATFLREALDREGLKHPLHGHNLGPSNPAGQEWYLAQSTTYGHKSRAEQIAEAFAQVETWGLDASTPLNQWLYTRTIDEARKRSEGNGS